MSNILSNIAALKSLYHLSRNQEGYATSMERISSGKRINAAGDDAAGASIVNRMTSQITGMQVAIRNAGDAISMAQTAEGAMNECSEILHRMRELAVQSANGTYSGADRVALNAAGVELKNELLRISETTFFCNKRSINENFIIEFLGNKFASRNLPAVEVYFSNFLLPFSSIVSNLEIIVL